MDSPQERHYDAIISSYDDHYHDDESELYRNTFINPVLFQEIDLKDKQVMEAMCGSGACGEFLLSRSAQVTALDISKASLDIYLQKWPSAKTVHASAIDTQLPSESFDVICVVGGLHHLPPQTVQGLLEFHRLLKRGGILCFAEPHDKSFLNLIRQLWYKFDHLFERNEQAINYEALVKSMEGSYEEIRVSYFGGPAYIFILNSLVWRMPKKFKRRVAPFLMWLETKLSPIFKKRIASGMLVAQWRKI